MRILFVTPYYKPYLGGVERVIENLSKEFICSGHEVAVLTSKYSFPRTYHADWSYIDIIDEVHVFRLSSWTQQPLPFFAAPLTFFSPLEVRGVIKEFRPDAVIYMTDKWFGVNFLVRLFTSRYRQIWSPIFHDLTLAKVWLRPINWLFGQMVNKVIVVTKLEAEKVKEAYGVESRKINIIPWGVSVQKTDDGVQKTDIRRQKTDVLTILSVGRISRHKGQEWLVERFLEILPKMQQNCRLVLVGEVEEPLVVERIRTLTKGVGQGSVVIGTDVNDEALANYYQQADIFALFPEYESFGLVFLEAMNNRLPVLTHKVGALEEVLGDGAVLVNPYDAENTRTSLLRMINDVAYRQELGTRGQEFVVQNYSWNKCAEGFIKFIL